MFRFRNSSSKIINNSFLYPKIIVKNSIKPKINSIKPKIIYADGTELHYKNGKLHRSNGSPVITTSLEFYFK
jgi:hypothetical protein